MRKLLGLLVFCLLLSPAWATDYYAAANGDDTLAGTSPATAWATCPLMNTATNVPAGLTLLPGDRCLMRRGDTFHAFIQFTAGTQGTATNPITFADYGTGAKPIIDGANVLTGWASIGGNKWTVTFNPGFTFHQVIRNGLRAVNETTTGALTANYEWNYTGTTLTIFSTTDPTSDGSTWEGGARFKGIRNDTSSFIVLANIRVTRIDDNGGTGGGYAAFPSSPGQAANVVLTNVDFDLINDNCSILFDLTVTIANYTFNNDTCDHSSARGSDIPGFSIGQGSNKSGLGVSNITFNGGSATYAGVHGAAGVTVQQNFGLSFSGCTNCAANGFVAMFNGNSGLAVGDGSNGVTVNGGALDSNGLDHASDDNGFEVGGFGLGSSNVTITGTEIAYNYSHNIEIASTLTNNIMANVTITKCKIHDSVTGIGIAMGGGHTGQLISYNSIYHNFSYGYRHNAGTSGNPAVKMYNNAFWANGADNVQVGATGLDFKNNITGEAVGQEMNVLATITLTANGNDYYHSAGGSFMTYQAVTKTFATWKTASSQDANSISALPLFQNLSSFDFRPVASSPIIDAGINLGSTYQTGLNEAAPVGYSGVDQNLFGTAWEIGPYVYDSTVVPNSGVIP